MKIKSFYDLSVLILGELPTQFAFLNSIFAFVLALVFFAFIFSVFTGTFKLLKRW